jgi:hypothetical protein
MATRSFVCDDIVGGRFTGKVPSVVAKKVARKLLQDSKTTVYFSIRETTKDSAKKTFNYVGTKQTISPPKIVKRGDVEIRITKEYIVKKA